MPKFYKLGERKNRPTAVIRGSIDGVEYEIPTEATNKRNAEKDWDKFKAAIREKAPLAEETFADAVVLYQETGDRTKAQMALVEKINAKIGDVFLDSIKPSDIQRLAKKISPKGKASTRNRNIIGPARAVINCAADSEWCSHIKIKNFVEEEVIRHLPSEGTAELLLANTTGFQRLYIAALHYQGLRHSDALSLKWENINLKEHKFSLIVPKPKKLKTIVMDENFFIELTAFSKEKGDVFPWKNRSSIYSWLDPLCKKLNVSYGSRMARHKFASDLVAVGASEHDLVNNGSWTNTRSVAPYVTLNEDRARDMLKRKNTGRKTGKIS
jgi:integrase